MSVPDLEKFFNRYSNLLFHVLLLDFALSESSFSYLTVTVILLYYEVLD